MKKLFICSISFLALLSCDNEVDINAPYRDITVMYGLLDPAEDTNWIRVQRGYLGTDAASASFDEPDSLYYNNAEVILRSYNDNTGEFIDSSILVEDNSIPLKPGTFTTEGHRLYRTTDPIFSDREYEVIVRKPEYGPIASGRTFIVDTIDIRVPREGSEFSRRLLWRGSSKTELYQIYMTIFYREYDLSTKQLEDKELEFYLGDKERLSNQNSFEITFTTPAFLGLIRDGLVLDPNKIRFFKKLKFVIWAADEDLITFMRLNQPSSGGISQLRPVFPDITNGIGILASRTSNALDSLSLSQSLSRDLQLDDILCAYQFATINVDGDTCICNDLPGSDNSQDCF